MLLKKWILFVVLLGIFRSEFGESLKCHTGSSSYNGEAPEEFSTNDPNNLCCSKLLLESDDLNYASVPISSAFFDKINLANNSCFFAKEPLVDDPSKMANEFVCCCNESLCNSNAFVKYHFFDYMETKEKDTSDTILQYVPIIVFVVLLLVLMVICYTTLDCCIVQPHKNKWVTEMPPNYYSNLRGTKILPYLTKGEAKMVIQQIKTARTTELPEAKSLTKKPEIIGIYSYSTTATVTNRELGAVTLGRTDVDPYLSTLIRMIEIGPREVRFDGDHLLDIIDKAESIFKSEPTLLDVPLPVQIYGDIHGQYSDLLRWFHLNGWPPTTRCCFLGDYVDRGRHSIEVIVMLFLLKIVMPYDVYLCRGNHEDMNINKVYSFYAEIEARLDQTDQLHEKVFNRFMQCFTYMPLACRIGQRVLGMHGGISPKLESWDDILNIKRPAHFINGTLACDLGWSDPSKTGVDFEVNYKRDRRNGIGYLFGIRQVRDLCKLLDIDLILRGHQAPMPGYEMFGDKLITVFSAPGYRTSSELETNYGSSINLDINGSMIITRIGVDNHVRLLRELQKLDKGEAYTDMNTLVLKPKHEDDDGSDSI